MNKASEMRKLVKNNFPKKLKSLLSKHDFKQEDLESKIGLGRGGVSNYVRATAIPSLEAMMSIAQTFNVTMDYLIGFEETSKETIANEPNSGYGSPKALLERIEELSGDLAIAKYKLKECMEGKSKK